MTVSSAEDKLRTDKWDEALAALRDLVTMRRAVSAEPAVLKPD